MSLGGNCVFGGDADPGEREAVCIYGKVFWLRRIKFTIGIYTLGKVSLGSYSYNFNKRNPTVFKFGSNFFLIQ